MNGQKRNVNTLSDNFQQVTLKPESFLNAEDSLLKDLKSNLKDTYDYCKDGEKKINNCPSLPELIIRKFDVEQIWQQIELQNEWLLSQSITDVSRLVVGKNQLIFDNIKVELENNDSNEQNENIETNHTDDTIDEEVSESNSDSESEMDKLELNEDDESNGDHSDDSSKEEIVNTKSFNPSKKKSVVDDEFFKLDEMEKFLNVEEKKIENEDKRKDDSEDSDHESINSIDLFKEDSEDDDDNEEERTKTAKFKDFFVANDNKQIKRNKFLEDMSEDEENNDSNEMKSTLELRQERLKKKIEEMEQNAVREKSWQLKGEIRAEDRPQNSLLEEVVEFDLTSRPAPIITEQTTLQLEDIIRQRIKDRVFDSVERKIKPVESLPEYKKKLVLDQEKSKQSLAQLYEKEFLDQQAALDPENADKEAEEPALHKEIKTMMRSLFNKLDALSNFHFTPRLSVPELKIVNNLPAITMEEVAPNAASDAALLAPEEVQNKAKGEIIAKDERTATDKNRERRKKKLKQRAHIKEKQKRESLGKFKPGLGNKYSKEKAKKMLQKLTSESNTEKMDEHVGSKAVKSSTAFFTQLQEEVQSQIHGKIENRKSKKKKSQLVAKKIKL